MIDIDPLALTMAILTAVVLVGVLGFQTWDRCIKRNRSNHKGKH